MYSCSRHPTAFRRTQKPPSLAAQVAAQVAALPPWLSATDLQKVADWASHHAQSALTADPRVLGSQRNLTPSCLLEKMNMMDTRKWAFVGLVGLVSVACSSSSGISGTGGSSGAGTGGSSDTGGSSSTDTGGTSSTGTGGSSADGSASATLGCQASDTPASAAIADFGGGDASIQIMGGFFVYGDANPQPTYTVASNQLNITDDVQVTGKNHYQGVGIYFNGNTAGTDCINASAYTGIQFDISGSLTGTGCGLVFSINDSEHGDSSTLNAAGTGPNDPKAAGPQGSYPPQLSIPSSSLTSTAVTIKVPFTGAGAPAGGSPATPIDPTKIEGVQWQLATPLAAAGGATECNLNINVANVQFY